MLIMEVSEVIRETNQEPEQHDLIQDTTEK
jgi:hypothetical protein